MEWLQLFHDAHARACANVFSFPNTVPGLSGAWYLVSRNIHTPNLYNSTADATALRLPSPPAPKLSTLLISTRPPCAHGPSWVRSPSRHPRRPLPLQPPPWLPAPCLVGVRVESRRSLGRQSLCRSPTPSARQTGLLSHRHVPVMTPENRLSNWELIKDPMGTFFLGFGYYVSKNHAGHV